MSAIAFTNRADAAILSALNMDALSPVSNLLNEHISVKFRYTGTSLQVDFDLGASYSLDTFALMGVSGSTPSFTVSLSTVPSPVGDVFASGTLSGTPYFDSRYKKFVYLRTTPLSGRYVRIVQSEGGVAYTEWGRPFIGLRNTFGTNYQVPYSRTPVRKSKYTRGDGGSTFVDRKKGTWRQNVGFRFLTEVERTGFMEDMAVRVVNEGHIDFLWIPDPLSTNLARDCIWGFQVSDEQPVSQTFYSDPSAPQYAVDFQIEDRG